jgi:asparagine synthase (glutamine-hydrolysing)
MRPRYLVAVSTDAAAIDAIDRRVRGNLTAGTTVRTAAAGGYLLVMTSASAPIAIGQRGMLLGSVFKRGSPGHLQALDEAEQDAIIASRGTWLINACWGGYIAIIADPDCSAIDIIRAPLGDLACHVVNSNNVLICASDLGLLLASGLARPSLDPDALAHHLAADDIRRSETCLSGVSELPGGDRISVGGGRVARQTLWSPWPLAGRDRQIDDPGEAARRLRDTAVHCVGAQAEAFGPVLLKLSGGLDSSIVAACLAASNQDFSCLTLATHDPAGDERRHARLVTAALGAPLFERFRDPSRVMPLYSAAARLARPTARSFGQESARHVAEIASDTRATAIFDGGGGDNVFCSLQSVRPAADCLMTEAPPAAFWRTAGSIAQLAQTSLFTVAVRAWRTSRRRSPDYPWPMDLRFLSPEARRASAGAAAHPWLVAPSDALPGKAAHVALITAAQSVVEGFDAEDALPICSPLISQPMIELCLRIPSWLWFEDGQNRAIARRAFSRDLPAETIGRRSKGAPDSFVADIYQANRAEIRSMLKEGVLHELGLLDLVSLSAVLDDPSPLAGYDFLRVMQLADAEAWARCWR